MSLTRSFALQCFERGNMVELCYRLMFDLYLGLPRVVQLEVYGNYMEAFVAAIKWLGMVHASEKLRTYNTVVGRILTTVTHTPTSKHRYDYCM